MPIIVSTVIKIPTNVVMIIINVIIFVIIVVVIFVVISVIRIVIIFSVSKLCVPIIDDREERNLLHNLRVHC